MNATYNGRTYRVIYTAEGDLWARDILANIPTQEWRKSKYKPNQASLKTNAETAVMVYKYGAKRAAIHYGVTRPAITSRIRRLEKWLGYRIFPSYGYSELTALGEKFIRFHTEAP